MLYHLQVHFIAMKRYPISLLLVQVHEEKFCDQFMHGGLNGWAVRTTCFSVMKQFQHTRCSLARICPVWHTARTMTAEYY